MKLNHIAKKFLSIALITSVVTSALFASDRVLSCHPVSNSVEVLGRDGQSKKVDYRKVDDWHIQMYGGKNITLKMKEGRLDVQVGEKKLVYIDEDAGRVTDTFGMLLYGIDGKSNYEVRVYQMFNTGKWGADIFTSKELIASYPYTCRVVRE